MKKVIEIIQAGDRVAKEGDHEAAIEEYKRAWDVLGEPKGQQPLAIPILNLIYGQYRKLGNELEGVGFLEKAYGLPKGKTSSAVNFNLGKHYFDLDDLEKAKTFLKAAWELSEGRLFEDADPKYEQLLR